MSFFFFCFKQKTAYEMRISDWSSDVCSSDLNLITAADRLENGIRSFAMKKAFWMAAAAVLAIPAIASAQNTMQHQGMKAHSMDEPGKRTDVQQTVAQYFGAMDIAKDGAVTRSEHDAYQPAMSTPRPEAHFAA